MEHKTITEDKDDVRTSWFMQQHYTPEELQQLYEWEQAKGKICKVLAHGEGFNAFHVLDVNNTIDLSYQKEREQLLRWVISRMGYVTEDGETYKGD